MAMSPEISRVLDCFAGGDAHALSEAARACPNLDERLDDGESALFHAVLPGRAEFVETMLTGGAHPNFRATGPAKNALARTPLELAQQARFLLDWERYHPIAILLQAHGARDAENRI